jgi:DNA repair photolyase
MGAHGEPLTAGHGSPPRSGTWQDEFLDLRAQLLALVEPRGIGDTIIEGARLEDASAEVGLRLRFDVGGHRMWVEVAPIERDARWAACTDRLALSYRTEGGRSRVPAHLGLDLCRELARLFRGNEARVFDQLGRHAMAQVGQGRVRRVEVSRLLDLVGPREASYYALNPYVGCLIGCTFCYAQSKLAPVRRLLGFEDAPWGSYVEVRRNAHEVLARELETLPVAPVKFCPIVSDPYHAIEIREQVTRRCLEVLRDADRVWPTLIMTRSTAIVRDLDLIASLPRVYGSVSLPTIDDEVRKCFEPRAASIPERLDVLAQLRAAGVRTIAVVQPLLAGSIDALADALAQTVESVSIDILRGEEGATTAFDDPRHVHTRGESWQTARALELKEMLLARGVRVWHDELPPELCEGAQLS